MLPSCQHFIVFYTSRNGLNDLHHLIGFKNHPTIDQDLDAINEFKIIYKLSDPVYMGHMPREAVMEIFGIS